MPIHSRKLTPQGASVPAGSSSIAQADNTAAKQSYRRASGEILNGGFSNSPAGPSFVAKADTTAAKQSYRRASGEILNEGFSNSPAGSSFIAKADTTAAKQSHIRASDEIIIRMILKITRILLGELLFWLVRLTLRKRTLQQSRLVDVLRTSSSIDGYSIPTFDNAKAAVSRNLRSPSGGRADDNDIIIGGYLGSWYVILARKFVAV